MRVLVSTNPMFGHFVPVVPLARSMQERGHEVLVATEPAFVPTVQAHGLEAVGVGRDLSLDDMLAVLPEIFEVAPEDQDAYARPRVFIELRANNLLDDLVALVDRWGPQLVLRESAEFASWAIAERRGIPHVTINVGASGSAEEWDAMAAPWFRDLGGRVGMADLNAASIYRHGVLSFEPAGYYDWSHTPSARVFRQGPAADASALDAAVTDLDDRPLIYATLGTEFYNADLMRSIIAALADGNRNLVVTTGPQGAPADVDPRAPGVVVTRWVPQDQVLDRAALVVSHAGAGTVTGALVRGVPVVCLPQGADQFHHAARAEALGVGVALDPDQRSVEEIRAAVEQVITDAGYREAAEAIAAATANLPDVGVAAAFLEELGGPAGGTPGWRRAREE